MKRKKVKLPECLEFAYSECLKRCFQLKNGWIVAVLTNGSAVFYNDNFPERFFPKFKKVDVAPNGLFMITFTDGCRDIFDAEGKQLSISDTDCMLFHNGWYRIEFSNKRTTLFNDKGIGVGFNLRTAEVYKDGRYFMSCILPTNGRPGAVPGLYEPDGTQIHFTNSKEIIVLKNGLFIDFDSLYDSKGNLVIEPINSIHSATGRRVVIWLLKLYGSLMKRKA